MSFTKKHIKGATHSTKRTAVSLCIATALGLSVPSAGFAQEEVEDEEIIKVTGSRIPSDPNVTSSVPLQSIDADDIKLSGELNLADVVNDIPALISSLTAENSVTGANALNLRGLGSERTLTLVNGRRHVAGFRGTSAVDIGTIPRALVKRVEVTTGGASAIYGADAVTGVVNFILKDDFEGIQVDAQTSAPFESGGESFGFDIIVGENFDNDRGNIVFAATLEKENSLTFGQRDWARNNGIATVEARANPDPDGSDRAVINDPRFWLTSQEGSIAPTFGGRDVTYVDINNNGIADCQESEGGRVGFLAGCWVTNPDGSVRVNTDGIVLNGLWGIGGDGGRLNFDRDTLMPSTDKYVINLNAKYELTDTMVAFFEAKYVSATSTTFGEQDTFYDTLFILPDNPFIPEALQPVVDVTGGLLLTQDPLDFSDNNPFTYKRETQRFVAGIQGDIGDDHRYELSINHGKFTNTSRTTANYIDRIFAAIDAVEGPDGNIVCRSDIDADAFYEIDYFTAGNGFADGGFASNRYYTFTPGDGQCAPLNPFGTYSASEAAQNFVTAELEDVLEIEQTVINFFVSGEFYVMESLLDGPIGYATGLEYREESSDNKFDPITLGILPEGTSLTPGVLANTIDPFLNSFTSIDNDQQFNTFGEYDVSDAFLEVRLPIFLDRDFAKELTIDAAIRVADYSTLGNATTWKAGLAYAPMDDISFRATFSEAVRAPNISELFDPLLPTTISATADPCDPGNVTSGTSVRQANCVASLQAAGVAASDILDGNGDYIWVNPLTGRFAGTTGGNPDLEVETAETFTVGTVIRPSFIEGLTITVDYWSVEIEDAIRAVSADDILNGCFDSASFPALDFCDQFERRSDGGLTDLSTVQINFARQEAEGIDFSVNYTFSVDENDFEASLVGTRQKTLNNFFNTSDLTEVNPEVEEVQLPKTSGNFQFSWERGPLNVSFQTTYMSRQSVDEIEVVLGLAGNQALYGDAGFFDEVFIHDINASYEINDSLSIFGGINNLADEEPYATQTAWPVGPRGRTLFMGISYRN
ncbi:TonB-dependent receptor domain-containing protein [Glaciecola petra]|uniref:TonB-dependent receptor n=1 Tax=Glaciecola petra TaxID=3075602 RepID=A0ABU2ZL11_9ALTE|nr:TonB-dependent receptor [Aestuariibacter sp. P117]MDT0593310.1 TonB-dependent receptor [Aestuariibacter sp. P117]